METSCDGVDVSVRRRHVLAHQSCKAGSRVAQLLVPPCAERRRTRACPKGTGNVRGLLADTLSAPTDPRRLSVTDIEVMDPEVSRWSCARGQGANVLQQQRSALALKLKALGNKAYSNKKFTEAIEYYSKAIECEEQAVFYSNRAACK